MEFNKEWVHGFLGGPPCATWSKARAVQHSAEKVDLHRRLSTTSALSDAFVGSLSTCHT